MRRQVSGEKVKGELGIKVLHREFEQLAGAYALSEPSEPYPGDSGSETDALRLENTISWDEMLKMRRTWRGPIRRH
jgi:hypothetical protein